MRWNTPTHDGWQWHFALIPRQLEDESWAWLEWVQKQTRFGWNMFYAGELVFYRAAPKPVFTSCRSQRSAE